MVQPPNFSLPSIHEMFPEHLMASHSSESLNSSQPQSRLGRRSPQFSEVPRERPVSVHSSDVKQSSYGVRRPTLSVAQFPSSSSTIKSSSQMSNGSATLFQVTFPATAPQHRGSLSLSGPVRFGSGDAKYPRDYPPPLHPSMKAFQSGHSSFPSSSNRMGSYSSDDLSDEGDDSLHPGSDSSKRHVCPTCNKRFNRPSSLRIHVNTHTGATPFRCPFPNCGREFNVNSNMRRHYRNHGASLPRAQESSPQSRNAVVPSRDAQSRRKRRALTPPDEPPAYFAAAPSRQGIAIDRVQMQSRFPPTPPIAAWSVGADDSEGLSDDDSDELMDEDDELTDHQREHQYRLKPVGKFRTAYPPPPRHPNNSNSHHPQSDIRSSQQSCSPVSSLSSPSLPPPSPTMSSVRSSYHRLSSPPHNALESKENLYAIARLLR
ncbi:hypothetical protein C8J56DRAFT_1020955 [Mycena floridula]|nr:hypothetical protein C8J56DRAFT_1020955 [Mycena floridula]